MAAFEDAKQVSKASAAFMLANQNPETGQDDEEAWAAYGSWGLINEVAESMMTSDVLSGTHPLTVANGLVVAGIVIGLESLKFDEVPSA